MPPFVTYVEAGLSCIPIRGDGSKAPAISAWKEFQRTLPTIGQAQQWAQQFPGVALLGGAVSGNLECIDLDEPALVRPFFEILRDQYPGLPERLCWIKTPRANESGQRGVHIVYRCETSIDGNRKLALSEPEPQYHADGSPQLDALGHHKHAPRTLIETRGEGGYFITVGSAAECHPSGRTYDWHYGRQLTDLETLTEQERRNLHAIARQFDRSIGATYREPAPRGFDQPGERPGDEFAQRTSWEQILEPAGWTCVGEYGGVKRWRRPGKQTGISATTGILSKGGSELFICFSSNAHPFEGPTPDGKPGTCYSKFAAFAMLNFGGDFASTAKHLADQGYGAPQRKTEQTQRVVLKTLASCMADHLAMIQHSDGGLLQLHLGDLDHALGGGVARGEMVVIGARPSHGKSSAALQTVMLSAAAGHHCAMFSLEMTANMIGGRSLQRMTSLQPEDWRDRAEHLQRFVRQVEQYAGKVFVIDGGLSIETIERETAKIATEFDLAFVVVDYLQLVQGKGTTTYEKVSDVSRRLKQLAIKHNCVLLVPTQLNRDVCKQGRIPQLHDLKDCGQIEQDADVVVMAEYPAKMIDDLDEQPDPDAFNFYVQKNRSRATRKFHVPMLFDAARQTFSSSKPANYNHDLGAFAPQEG